MLRDQAARRGAAGEPNCLSARVGDDLLTGIGSSMDQIHRAFRHTCLQKAFDESSCDHRGRWRRLPNHNIARSQRSREVLARDSKWIVPGSQDTDDSVRLAQSKNTLAGIGRRQQAGLQLGNVFRGVMEEPCGEVDLIPGFVQRLALLERELWCQQGLASDDCIGNSLAQPRPLENGEACHGAPRPASGRDRRTRVFTRGVCDETHNVACRWADLLECFPI